MWWSVVPFGKYRGKTLPQIIVRDLDWFFWVVPKLYGKLGNEAQDLAQKARAIKIPKSVEVEYRYEMDRRFCGFAFVEANSARYSRWVTRLPYLDLSWPLRRKKYDKRAARIMIRDFRIHYFGEHKWLTKKRCEEFFGNGRNFINV
jgi:uncharacterized protein (DUF3820 family)